MTLDEIVASIWQISADLADLPGPDPGEREARVLDRLAGECSEAAAAIRALPGRPEGPSGG